MYICSSREDIVYHLVRKWIRTPAPQYARKKREKRSGFTLGPKAPERVTATGIFAGMEEGLSGVPGWKSQETVEGKPWTIQAAKGPGRLD